MSKCNQYDELCKCSECELDRAEVLVSDERFSHARRGDGCWRDVVWIYYHDTASPSGVSLAGSADAHIADAALRTRRNTSALSPTER